MARASRQYPAHYLEQFSEADWAWLAGVIDGEGSIYTTRSRSTHYLCIQVPNTDERIIDRVSRMLDQGSGRGKWSKGSTKPLYVVSVSGHKAEVVFSKVQKQLTTTKGAGLQYKTMLGPRTYESTVFPSR